ncbi:MAG: hypothetical protein RL166_482 [Actinomycetota bacterium]|jgi:hypothetical protein
MGFGDKLKAGIASAKSEAAKVTKKGLEVAKAGAEVVADNAEKAAKSSVKAIKAGADAVAEKAVEAKEFADEKMRTGLDKAYASKKETAVANLKRVRKANPDATPSETLLILEKELSKAEEKSGADSDAFASATALYVFTAVELYGKKYKDPVSRQRLIDATVLVDSEAAKMVAALAGVGISLLLARLGGKAAGKALAKVAGAGALVSMLGIKNPGKKGAAWIAVTSVNKFLGPVPKAWPAASTAKKK